jgi:hypothetical protein
LATVVLMRSYSRICGATSLEIETLTPGRRSANQARDLLVVRVGEGVQEADGDRLDAVRLEVGDERFELGDVEGATPALGVEALVHLEAQRPRDERLRQAP